MELTPVGHALAGSGGSVLALMLTYPLDIIKTRLQVQTRESRHATHYVSTTHALRSILAHEGLGGLYAGMPAALVGVASTNFSYFYWHAWIRALFLAHLIKNNKHKNNINVNVINVVQIGTAAELILGAAAGAIAQIFTLPVSVITTRLQTQIPPNEKNNLNNHQNNHHRKHKRSLLRSNSSNTVVADAPTTSEPVAPSVYRPLSFWEMARKIIDEDGITGLWKGLKPSLVLTVNPAITYGLFERLKTLLLKSKGPNARLSPFEIFLLGLLSKTLATVVTYPYIMAKVRLQWRPVDYETNARLHYTGAIDVLKKVWMSEGWRGWYQGMRAQIVKAVLTQALLFVLKDKLAQWTYVMFACVRAPNKK